MGCGSSSNVVSSQGSADGRTKANGAMNGHNGSHDADDLPTVVLPETPIKPPIAFEIPLEEFDGAKRPNSPPPHLQRLLQPPQPEISLPDIEEKLAEAELRRQTILQQRAASAQKRTQKMMRTAHEMERLDNERDFPENTKHGTVTIPPEPGVCEDKNIA